MALNAIGGAPPSLAVDSARIARNRIGTASTYAPDAWGGNASALAEHPGAATVRIAKARHTREIPAAKTLHAVGVSGTSQTDNTRTRGAAFPDDADRGTSACARAIDTDVLAAVRRRIEVDIGGAAGDSDNTVATVLAAHAADAGSLQISLANNRVCIEWRCNIRCSSRDE
jgi:hypothetical protein